MKRIEWIDSLKGFGIFCVTIGHLACNFLLETHIYSFHMFLFFFISGFLHSDEQSNFKEYFYKKSKTILVPFIFWNILSVLVGILLGESIQTSIRLLFLVDGKICWNAPIWFLLLLYMTQIVFFFIKKYIPYGNYVSIPVLLVLWRFISNTNVFLKLNILPICLLFYILGNVFRQFNKRYSEHYCYKYKIILPVCAVLLCISLIFGVYLNNRISFTGAYFGNVFYCAIAAIAGVLFYVLLFQNMPVLSNNRVLLYFGKNSLIIMASQYWFFTFYNAVFSKFVGIDIWRYRSTLKALIVSLVTMALICLIVELLKAAGKKFMIVKKICGLFGIR